jgi:sigma-B regulation protein RsbU (phosphoserine phosphatase)
MRFRPRPYDERRVLLDLSLAAQDASDLDDLFDGIVRRICYVMRCESVSVFALDEATGEYRCRATTRKQPPPALPRDPFVARRMRRLTAPLDVDESDFDTWERSLAEAPEALRRRRSIEIDALRRSGARLLVPVGSGDRLVGILTLGPRVRGHRYFAADRETLVIAARQLALVIENSKLTERMVAEERLGRELALAAEVQSRLFPENPPAVRGIELAGVCIPARGVGGDYYDFLELGDGRVGLAVADVSGKGMSAALVMSSVQASLRTKALSDGACDEPLSDLVAGLNRLLCGSTGAATYVTFFYARLDAEARTLTYVNAGHNPPLLLRMAEGGGRREQLRLDVGGPVVGLFMHFEFEQASVALRSGDLLISFTDGVTEALDAAGEEFGEERLCEAVESACSGTARDVVDAVVERLHAWSAGVPQHDDITFVALAVQ